MSEECRSCHRDIDWAVKLPEEVSDRGLPKTMPIDASSVDDPKGNIEVWRQTFPADGGHPEGYSVLYARYLKKGEEPATGHHRGISHFATCPERDRWRRSRVPPGPAGGD